MNKVKKIMAYASAALATVLFLAVTVMGILEMNEFAGRVGEIRNLESYADADEFYAYRSLMVSRGFRSAGTGDEELDRIDVLNYLAANSAIVWRAIISFTAVYAILITIVASYFLWDKFGKSRIPAIPLCAILSYELILIPQAVIWLLKSGFELEFQIYDVIGFLCTMLGVLAGGLVIEMLYRFIKARVLVILIAVVLFIACYFEATLSKIGLYSEEFKYSFGYVCEIDPRFADPANDDLLEMVDNRTMYYDGVLYKAEKYPNPDYPTGGKRVLMYALEVINPTTAIMEDTLFDSVSVTRGGYDIFYLIQSAAWVAILSFINIKRKNSTER